MENMFSLRVRIVCLIPYNCALLSLTAEKRADVSLFSNNRVTVLTFYFY